MTSSSENSTKREKVVGFTLTSTEKGGWHQFYLGGLLEKGGYPYFLGGLQTQGETMSI